MPATYRAFMTCSALLVAAALLLCTTTILLATRRRGRFLPARSDSPRTPPSTNDTCGSGWGDWNSTTNATGREPSDFTGTDWNVYWAFASRHLSPRNVELLSTSERASISSEVGLAFHVAARVFTLCHSYINSFNLCHYKLLSDPGPCSADAAATNVIVVHSLPASSQRRMDIRARLLQHRTTGYRLVFLLGRSESVQSEAEVQNEAAKHRDIIWADFIENYDNLTIKTIVMLRWMEQNCLSANYLVKADDDVYLKVSNLDAVLRAHVNQTHVIIGMIGYGEGAYRHPDQKWYMPMYMFSGSTYPPFAHGPSYVISTDLIADLNKAALKINYMHLEDIFLAVCASTLANVHHVHIPSFISGSCGIPNSVALHGLLCA